MALGKRPGDLLLKNARIVNVYSGEVENGDVLVAAGLIAAVGATGDLEPAAKPGFGWGLSAAGADRRPCPYRSDHLHPAAFRAVASGWGTTNAVVADPQQVANVLGMESALYRRGQPPKRRRWRSFMAPSAVPATDMETAAAAISAMDIRHLLQEVPGFYGPRRDDENTPACCWRMRKPGPRSPPPRSWAAPSTGVPSLSGRELNGYLLAGISSGPEASTLPEAKRRIAPRPLFLLIQEGSAAKSRLSCPW